MSELVALSAAIEMLRDIGHGTTFPAIEYWQRVHAFEAALRAALEAAA